MEGIIVTTVKNKGYVPVWFFDGRNQSYLDAYSRRYLDKVRSEEVWLSAGSKLLIKW